MKNYVLRTKSVRKKNPCSCATGIMMLYITDKIYPEKPEG